MGASCGDYLYGYVLTCITSVVLGGWIARWWWVGGSPFLRIRIRVFYEWFPCVGRFSNLGLGWVSGFGYMEALSGDFF